MKRDQMVWSKGGSPGQTDGMTASRFLAVGPDPSRRAFVALALGASAAVIMPLPPAKADDGLVSVTTPCAPEQVMRVTRESCEVVSVFTPRVEEWAE